jgi:serine/threonine protein kinase
VHRDLKPENLMLCPGADGRVGVKILDFGLAKEMIQQSGSQTVGSNLTAPGTVLGTYTYMAPEQLSGKPVDARADLFALGVIVAESLTGTRPFQGKTLADLIRSLLHDDFHLPGDSPEIRRLNAALQRALAKDPQNRFSSATEMRRELIPALRACA